MRFAQRRAGDGDSEGSGLAWAQRIQTGLTRADLNAFPHRWGISPTGRDSALIGLSGPALKVSKRHCAATMPARSLATYRIP